MAKRKLEPLWVKFHEPDTELLNGAVYNQKFQLENLEKSKTYIRSTRKRGLIAEIDQKKKSIGDLEKTADVLKKWRIKLGPYVDPLKLIPLYDKKKIPIPADISQWSSKFDFYVLNFGGDIFVEKGMKVKLLEIGIVFEPNLNKKQRRSIAYSIFPTNEWKKYGGVSIAFGLNADLGFEIPLTANGIPIGQIGKIGPEIKSQLLLGPFKFDFKKSVIRGIGKGNYIVNWIIEKGKLLEQGDFETKVILKVPKGRQKMEARAVLQATVIPPGFFKHVFGNKITLAPAEQIYSIQLS
ncbi:hypothetical protein ACFLR7_04270 [Acidobacteriota bacterium]